ENLLAVAERQLLVSRVAEAINEARFEVGRLFVQDLAASRADRLAAEIALLELRARYPNAVAAPPKPGPAKNPAAEPEPPRVTDEEMAEMRRLFPRTFPPPGDPPANAPPAGPNPVP